MVEDLLKLGGSFVAAMVSQICETTNIDWIESKPVYIAQFILRSGLKRFDGLCNIIATDCKRCTQSRQVVILDNRIFWKAFVQIIHQRLRTRWLPSQSQCQRRPVLHRRVSGKS